MPYGTKKLRNQLDKSSLDFIESLLPALGKAVTRAEGDPTGKFGVRSIETENPKSVLLNSIINNYARWKLGMQPAPWIKEKPEKFVDFMQRRWAPVGAENDPKNLNKNWAPNVRSILRQWLGEEEYKRLQDLNLVRNQGVTNGKYPPNIFG